MKRMILCLIIILYVFSAFPAYALDREEIISDAAVLMDAKTGQVIFDKNMDKMMYPASTTKIMTGLLTAELCQMDEIALVNRTAVEIDVWDSSNIALTTGERMPVDSLMYALMLPSANDAANVLAEHIAGSQSDFARMMTERALKIGAMSTNFSNAHGLHDPNHYTTAYDLALIMREAAKNPVFMRYAGTGTHTIPATNLQPLERPFTNYHYMLVDTTRYYDPDVTGGKIGYTQEAGHTMSTIAERDGRTLICVVLNSRNRYDKFKDTRKLLDFGFEEFTEITVSKEKFAGFTADILDGIEQAGTVAFSSEDDFTALLHNSADPDSVAIAYSHDRSFEADEEVSAFVSFTAESENPDIPALLGKAGLKADISLFEQADPVALGFRNEFDETAENHGLTLPAIAGSIVFLLVSGFFAIRQYGIYMRRKRRRARLSRLRREHDAYSA